MNISLPVCFIPDELGWVMRNYFHNNRKNYSVIADQIYSSSVLRILIPKVFKEFMKNNNIESMLNALGWNGFRDRLASLYVYKYEMNHYPTKTDIRYVEEIKTFEYEFIDFFPEGNSRLFMLGFYLKLSQIALNKKHEYGHEDILKVNPVVKQILKLGTQKTIKPDWLILVIMSLTDLLGDEDVVTLFSKTNGQFYKIIKEIKKEHREKLFETLLSYGTSISDDEMFLYEKV